MDDGCRGEDLQAEAAHDTSMATTLNWLEQVNGPWRQDRAMRDICLRIESDIIAGRSAVLDIGN